MEVEFADDALDRLETDARYGAGLDQAIVKAFRKRMQAIRAAANERDLYAVRGNGFERLKGKRAHQCSLVLTGNWRLIIELVEHQSGKKARIVEIVDYH